ncbi:MAG TPA: hypothetical protein V6C71_09410 [Coleofasciculaceae cyanobacterium]|jgi:membrane-bound ClpP family serine protease
MSVIATYGLVFCLLASVFNPAAIIVGLILAVLLLYLNWDVYRLIL